jgi:hypothetical protein
MCQDIFVQNLAIDNLNEIDPSKLQKFKKDCESRYEQDYTVNEKN